MSPLLAPLVVLLARSPVQELFLRDFGPAEGLAHERVNGIVEDPQGYLWIATWEGISRFDGRGFTSYGTPEGLAVPLVFTLALDPEGRLWAAPHAAGVARLEEGGEGGARFRSFPVGSGGRESDVGALLFDERGAWVATPVGVFRAREREAPSFEPVWRAPEGALDYQSAFLAQGRGWIVGVERVLELGEDGVRERAGPGGAEPGVAAPRDSVHAQAADGRALLVAREGLYVFDAAAAARGAEPWTRLAFELEPEEVVHATAIDARGRFWLATVHGLLVLEGEHARRITSAQGLPDDWLRVLAFDRAGTLWIGSNQGGLTALRQPAIDTFRGAQRERMTLVRLIEDSRGTLWASANDRGLLRLEAGVLVPLPGSEVEPFRNVHMRVLQDRAGDWWLGAEQGAWRVRGPELELARAESVPLPAGGVLGEFFEDSDGRISCGGSDQGLYRLDRSADEPAFERVLPSGAFAGVFPRTQLAARGETWIATNDALYRLRGKEAERVRPRGALALEELQPRALLSDSRGWLWVGTRYAGAAFAREPAAAEPVFERLSLREGLPSEHVPALAEDDLGRVWLGTGRGLARFDPRDGSLRRFSSADGLAGDIVNDLVLGRDGALWAAVAGGLSRIDPLADPAPSAPPPVYIRRFEAGGRPVSVPGSGVRALGELELAPSERAVVVGFAGIDLANGASLRFQQRLLGLDQDWSEPGAETTARYGSLAPGAYRFEVRALTYDGVESAAPATVEFTLAAPLWRRPWFVALLLLLGAGALFLVRDLRARRRYVLERIRSQIASDLHDEVGAGLAQIAVLSEVARRAGPEANQAQLGEVAALARATKSAMSDLVWAIDPRRDTLQDLLQRLHGVTANLFGGGRQELVLRFPLERELAGIALAPDRRRHLLLFFKEAAHNVERHAAAARVEIELALTRDGSRARLHLSVRDDGRGFDPGAPVQGQGLAGLRRRARALDAELAIDSAPGRGTRIELDVPL